MWVFAVGGDPLSFGKNPLGVLSIGVNRDPPVPLGRACNWRVPRDIIRVHAHVAHGPGVAAKRPFAMISILTQSSARGDAGDWTGSLKSEKAGANQTNASTPTTVLRLLLCGVESSKRLGA